jgi:hypothetical protein
LLEGEDTGKQDYAAIPHFDLAQLFDTSLDAAVHGHRFDSIWMDHPRLTGREGTASLEAWKRMRLSIGSNRERMAFSLLHWIAMQHTGSTVVGSSPVARKRRHPRLQGIALDGTFRTLISSRNGVLSRLPGNSATYQQR